MPLDPLRITNKSEGSGGIGDMLKAIYDPDNDGCVTCADSSTVANTASFADEAGYLTDMTALQAQELTGGGNTTLHSHPAAPELTSKGARVYANANQIIPNGGDGTKLSFSTVRWDTDGLFDIADPTKLTIKTDGVYIITALIEWATSANGVRYVDILLNNTDYIGIESRQGASAAIYMHATSIYTLKAGDYIEVLVFQNSGGNLDVVYETQASPELTVQRIGAWSPPA